MSKQMVRSILAGTALVIALNVTFPVSSEAAGLSPLMDSGNMVELVLHWFSSLWNGSPQGNGHRATAKTVASPAPGSSTTSGTVVTCGGDQGVCIDPNG
jgi:hypothetical protein